MASRPARGRAGGRARDRRCSRPNAPRASGRGASSRACSTSTSTGLAQRFAHEHRGLKKLGGAYKADRDALAATAPTRQAQGRRSRQIGDAIAWQQARARAARRRGHARARRGVGRPETTGLQARLELARARARSPTCRRPHPLRRRHRAAAARSRPSSPPAPTPPAPACAPSSPRRCEPLLEHPLDRAADELREAGGPAPGPRTRSRNASTPCAARPRPRARPCAPRRRAKRSGRPRPRCRRSRRETAMRRPSAVLGAWAALDVDPDALRRGDRLDRARASAAPLAARRAPPPRLVAVTPDRAALDERAGHAGATRVDAFLAELDRERLTRRPRGRLRRRRGADRPAHADTAATSRPGSPTPRRSSALDDLDAAVSFCIERRVPPSSVVDVLERSALEATRRPPARPRTATSSARCAPPSATGSSTSTRKLDAADRPRRRPPRDGRRPTSGARTRSSASPRSSPRRPRRSAATCRSRHLLARPRRSPRRSSRAS